MRIGYAAIGWLVYYKLQACVFVNKESDLLGLYIQYYASQRHCFYLGSSDQSQHGNKGW
jgi:hypothetical protein